MTREEGHHLLKRLGKTKLRPGGVTATNWLLDQIEADEDTKILEVACNEAEHLINFSKKYNNINYGVDNNESWLNKGKERVKTNNLESNIKLLVADARKLPFEDNTFDIVLNEAMLTMLSNKDKKLAISEYFRVLKPGGMLLTHDIRQVKENIPQIKELQHILTMGAIPLTLENWLDIFKDVGFKDIDYISDTMTLLSEDGLLIDEGEEVSKQIFENAKTDPNKDQFYEMVDFFRNSEFENNMNYLALKCIK